VTIEQRCKHTTDRIKEKFADKKHENRLMAKAQTRKPIMRQRMKVNKSLQKLTNTRHAETRIACRPLQGLVSNTSIYFITKLLESWLDVPNHCGFNMEFSKLEGIL
jgi:hypothetical protein